MKRIDIVTDYNVINLKEDANELVTLPLDGYDVLEILSIANEYKNFAEPCMMVSVDETAQRLALFSESFISPTQKFTFVLFSNLTAPQQTIINDFIALL